MIPLIGPNRSHQAPQGNTGKCQPPDNLALHIQPTIEVFTESALSGKGRSEGFNELTLRWLPSQPSWPGGNLHVAPCSCARPSCGRCSIGLPAVAPPTHIGGTHPTANRSHQAPQSKTGECQPPDNLKLHIQPTIEVFAESASHPHCGHFCEVAAAACVAKHRSWPCRPKPQARPQPRCRSGPTLSPRPGPLDMSLCWR